MNTQWENVAVTQVILAVHVRPNDGKHVHKDRKHHGLVINDEESIKDYCFSDGTVMHTQPGSVFYLPKGSSYYVKTLRPGGCYAINFEAQLRDAPFCIDLRNSDSVKKHFQRACDAWRSRETAYHAVTMEAVYHGITQLCREGERAYLSSQQHKLIAPAMQTLQTALTDRTLSVARLATQCGISEVYFRKLFMKLYGVSPKAYIIERRMEYAAQLLSTGEFEVSQVALRCGYPEPCHFSREFKRRYGLSPKDYLLRGRGIRDFAEKK